MGREGSEEGGGEGKEESKQRGRWGGKRGEEAESEVGRKDMWLLAHYCILTSFPVWLTVLQAMGSWARA